MELRLEAGVPGGASDISEAEETSVSARGSFALKKMGAGRLVPSDREACVGGMFESDECTLQQEGSAMAIDDPQFCIICRQHA
jgi:hypothetical protein